MVYNCIHIFILTAKFAIQDYRYFLLRLQLRLRLCPLPPLRLNTPISTNERSKHAHTNRRTHTHIHIHTHKHTHTNKDTHILTPLAILLNCTNVRWFVHGVGKMEVIAANHTAPESNRFISPFSLSLSCFSLALIVYFSLYVFYIYVSLYFSLFLY